MRMERLAEAVLFIWQGFQSGVDFLLVLARLSNRETEIQVLDK